MNLNLKEKFNPWNDIAEMHDKFDTDCAVNAMDNVNLQSFVDFRMNLLEEEYEETWEAAESKDAEEFVDGLIDLVVVAIGTLDLLGVDVAKAWGRVMDANMSKEVGIKPSRPNPMGLPDLVKPAGWRGPSHLNNHGYLPEIWKEK